MPALRSYTEWAAKNGFLKEDVAPSLGTKELYATAQTVLQPPEYQAFMGSMNKVITAIKAQRQQMSQQQNPAPAQQQQTFGQPAVQQQAPAGTANPAPAAGPGGGW